MKERDLVALKQQIEEAKSKIIELGGRKKELLSNLKKNYGCSTIEEAQKKVKGYKSQLEELKKTQDKLIAKLDSEYDFS